MISVLLFDVFQLWYHEANGPDYVKALDNPEDMPKSRRSTVAKNEYFRSVGGQGVPLKDKMLINME